MTFDFDTGRIFEVSGNMSKALKARGVKLSLDIKTYHFADNIIYLEDLFEGINFTANKEQWL